MIVWNLGKLSSQVQLPLQFDVSYLDSSMSLCFVYQDVSKANVSGSQNVSGSHGPEKSMAALMVKSGEQGRRNLELCYRPEGWMTVYLIPR